VTLSHDTFNRFKLYDPKILEINDKHDDCMHPCTTKPLNTMKLPSMNYLTMTCDKSNIDASQL
jgi:hypothetical protein